MKKKVVHDGFRLPPERGERGENLHQGDIDKIIAMYKEGVKVDYISSKCGCDHSTVHLVLRRNNVAKRKHGSGNWRKGKVIDHA